MSRDSLLRDLGGANPYTLLGLSATATSAQIKDARRRLQRLAHPDLLYGDGERARIINIAADLLLDPERRALFDSGGAVGPDRFTGEPAPSQGASPMSPAEPAHGRRRRASGRRASESRASESRASESWVSESWASESRASGRRAEETGEPILLTEPPRPPRVIHAARWCMYLAAISCLILFVIGVVGTGIASDQGEWLANISEGLAVSAVPLAIWVAITLSLGAGIRRGWRGIRGGGWALTAIVLTPIGLGCGTLMNYTVSPAVAKAAVDRETLVRLPDLVQGTMVWAFPLGLTFAVFAMALTLAPGARRYLETMRAMRDSADQIPRHRRRWLF